MKFRKKPVVIEAEPFTGEPEQLARLGIRAVKHEQFRHGPAHDYFIDTLEGAMQVRFGDYVITGVRGERYPCKTDIFRATYEPAE